MSSSENFLWKIVSEIEPTQSQKEGAVRSQNHLRNILDGAMPGTILDSFLSGSYARDTAIRPIDDVDIIFIVNLSRWSTGTYWPLPSLVLNHFSNAIRGTYPLSSVNRQRRSVRLQMNHLDIDVVPAAYASSTDQRVIRIPDTDADSWILTAPKIHSEKATWVNQNRDGRFKPLVKLLKFWNKNLPANTSFKSFAIETMAVRVFEQVRFDSLHNGLLYFFDLIAYASGHPAHFRWSSNFGISLGMFAGEVLDVAGTGNNTVLGVSFEQKNRFVNYAVRSRDNMLEAGKSLYISASESKVREALLF